MKTRFLKIVFLLLLSLFTVVSCKNNSGGTVEMVSLETTVTPSNAGTVSPSQGTYEAGEEVQITATPNSHWVFKEWNGSYTGTDNPATVVVNQNMNINALFEELTYPLTIEVEGSGQVNEEIVTAKTDYTDGTIVQLTAVPDEHWQFVEWSGDLTGMDNPATITMDQAKTVTAVFEEQTYPLTINIEGEGDVSEEVINAKNYTYGTVVELTATPADEWHFVEWTGDIESNENPATITVDGEKTVNAVFGFGFNEDFEDGEANNWIFSDDRFSIKDGKLQFSDDDNKTDWGSAYFDKKFTNFKIEVKVARTESKGSNDASMTILIRSNGFLKDGNTPSDGYEISITQDGYGSVWKAKDGVETNIIPWLPVEQLKTGLGKYNVITVNLLDSEFDVYVNGEYVIGFSDDTFTEGYVGIATYTYKNENHKVMWDYVKVTQADHSKSAPNNQLDINAASGSSAGSSSGHAH